MANMVEVNGGFYHWEIANIPPCDLLHCSQAQQDSFTNVPVHTVEIVIIHAQHQTKLQNDNNKN